MKQLEINKFRNGMLEIEALDGGIWMFREEEIVSLKTFHETASVAADTGYLMLLSPRAGDNVTLRVSNDVGCALLTRSFKLVE